MNHREKPFDQYYFEKIIDGSGVVEGNICSSEVMESYRSDSLNFRVPTKMKAKQLRPARIGFPTLLSRLFR